MSSSRGAWLKAHQTMSSAAPTPTITIRGSEGVYRPSGHVAAGDLHALRAPGAHYRDLRAAGPRGGRREPGAQRMRGEIASRPAAAARAATISASVRSDNVSPKSPCRSIRRKASPAPIAARSSQRRSAPTGQLLLPRPVKPPQSRRRLRDRSSSAGLSARPLWARSSNRRPRARRARLGAGPPARRIAARRCCVAGSLLRRQSGVLSYTAEKTTKRIARAIALIETMPSLPVDRGIPH
jgi:hypothetical protein